MVILVVFSRLSLDIHQYGEQYYQIGMISSDKRIQMHDLYQSGSSVGDIALAVDVSPSSVYAYIRQGKNRKSKNTTDHEAGLPKKIIPHKDYLMNRILKDRILNASRLYQELKEKGYKGSYPLVNNYLKGFLSEQKTDKAYPRSKVLLREPGEEAQVDWGYLGKIKVRDKIKKAYVFVYVLSYSRYMYAQVTISQDVTTLQECHMNAFDACGMPKNILYDNMKTVVISRSLSQADEKLIKWNSNFKQFALYYGFTLQACHPFWPRSKGKVESAVKYIKANFMEKKYLHRHYHSVEELDELLKRWLSDKANTRFHTAIQQSPAELWITEKKQLKFPSPEKRFKSSPSVTCKVYKDGVICFKTNLYEVPEMFILKSLQVRKAMFKGESVVEIYSKENLIMRYPEYKGIKNKWIRMDEALYTNESPKEARAFKKKQRKEREKVYVRELQYYDNL